MVLEFASFVHANLPIIQEYGALFDRNNPDTVKLGPQNVSFDDIRLHQIFPVNNLIWTVELSYVVKK